MVINNNLQIKNSLCIRSHKQNSRLFLISVKDDFRDSFHSSCLIFYDLQLTQFTLAVEMRLPSKPIHN